MKIKEKCVMIGTYMRTIEFYIHQQSKTLILLETAEHTISHLIDGYKKYPQMSLTNILGTDEFEKQILQDVYIHHQFDKVIVGFTDDHMYREDGFFEYKNNGSGTFTFIGKSEDDVLTHVMYNSFL